jgi:hypothetical protein
MLAHSIACPGAVPVTLRPVSVCTALRNAGTRRAVARRSCVHPDKHGEVSGLKVLKAAMVSSSDGMSPELGPSVGPNGSAAPAGCLSRRAVTTSLSTVATAVVPTSRLAALPSRPFSTSLMAVVVLGVVAITRFRPWPVHSGVLIQPRHLLVLFWGGQPSGKAFYPVNVAARRQAAGNAPRIFGRRRRFRSGSYITRRGSTIIGGGTSV